MSSLSSVYDGAYGTLYYVRDMAKAVAYYKDVLNLPVLNESPVWTEFSFNGHTLCLHAAEEGQKIDGSGKLIVKVKGLREVVETLKSRGAEFLGDVHQVCEGGYSAEFKDPSGNVISLFEYLG